MLERPVQGCDLGPVGIGVVGCLVVHRGDGGLQLVRPGLVPAQRGGEERDALADEPMVPSASVLLVEWDEFAVCTGASGAPRLGEEQQAEEAGNLGFVGSEGRAPYVSGEWPRLRGQAGRAP